MNDQPSPSEFAVPPDPRNDLKALENALKSAYRMASITKNLLEHNLTTPQTNSFTDYNSFILQFDQAEDILFRRAQRFSFWKASSVNWKT